MNTRNNQSLVTISSLVISCNSGILILVQILSKRARMMQINPPLQTLIEEYESWIEHSNVWTVMIMSMGPIHPSKWFRLKSQAYGQSTLHEQTKTVRNSSNSAVNWATNNHPLMEPDPDKPTSSRITHGFTFKPYGFFDLKVGRTNGNIQDILNIHDRLQIFYIFVFFSCKSILSWN